MEENYFTRKTNNNEVKNTLGSYFSAHDLLMSDINDVPYLWKPFVPRGELTALIGPGDVGKSILIRDLAISIVNGEDNYLGYPLEIRSGKVLYVSLEDNKYRLATQIKKTRINRELSKNLDFITMFDDEDDIYVFEELDRILIENRYDAVMIDPISNLIFDDWKDQGALRRKLLKFDRLASDYDCALILLHHITKEASKGAPNANNAVGSQAFVNMARTVMELRRRPEKKEQRGLFVIKANGLDDDLKKAGMLLEMNKDFSYSKKTGEVSFSEFDSESNKKFPKEPILSFMKTLKEKGVNQANTIRGVQGKFQQQAPSESTLKIWMKEI